MSDLNLSIHIGAIDSASAVLRTVGKAVSDLASGNIVGAAQVAAGAAVAVGAASVKMAADYQQSLLKIQAYAGLTTQQMDSMSQSLLAMAPAVGVGPKELADALYPIVSSGYNAADALNILKLSAETAAASGAKTSVVADALTTSLGAMHAPASDAGHYMDMLNKIVSIGKGEVPQYAAVIGKLSLSAAGAGVDFSTMGAALADLTTHGIPSVAQASTYLGNLFTQVGVKTDALATHAKKAGIAFDAHKFATLDLAGKLDYLQQASGGTQGKLLALLGGSTTALKAFNALEQGTKALHANLDAMKDSAGATDAAFQTASSGFNATMKRAQAAMDVLMIQLGTTLLPVLSQVVNVFTALISGSSLGGFGPIMQNVSGMLGVFAANWQSLADSSKPFMASLHQFGALLGQLLPGFVSQALRVLNLLQLAFISLAKGAETIAGPWLQYIGQVLKGIQSAIEPVLNAIEGQFLPALDNLVAHIAPIIAAYFQWIAASGIIPIIFAIIGNAVGIVITVFSNLINIGLGIIDFFTKTEVGGALLKATLIALAIPVGILALAFISLAIEAVAGFIMAIPGMVAGFIAGAAGAWTMAAGVIALTWPILAVIAVIALIILAIQHWGQIVDWLKAAWGAISSWFMSMLGALGAFFVGVWNGIVAGLKAAWNFIVQVVRIGVMVMLAIIFAPIIAVAALFIWLYQHNTYFKRMIDAIVGFVKFGIGWLQHAWQTAVAWIIAEWNALVKFATDLWGLVSKTVSDKFSEAIAFVQSIWQKISSFFVNAWNTYIAGPLAAVWTSVSSFFVNAWTNYIVKPLTTLWHNVSNVFTSAWNTYIAGPLGGLWNSVSKWFTDLGTNAMNSGINFITMLVSGITSGAGRIWDAVTGIAKNIWKALGFHSPAEEGPGADADKWMPNLVSMLSSGLVAGVPKIQAAVNLVAKPLATIGHPGNAAGVSSPVAASAPSSGAGGTTVININIADPIRSRKDIQDMAKQVEDEMSKRLRRSGNMVTWTSGGAT